MASLHRDPRGRSPYWFVAYRGGDGIRTLKSTKEIDFLGATIVAQMMVRVAEEERRQDTTKEVLNGIVQDTLRRLGIETKPEPTCRQWLEQWLANERGSVSAVSYAKYSLVIRQFLVSLGSRSNLKLSQIGEQDVIRFRDRLLSEGRISKTVNTTVRNLLKRPFTVAVQSGIISKNPVALVRALRGQAASKAVFTLEQVQALLSVAEGDWRGLVLCGFYLGGRISDMANLRWSNIDLDRGVIRFTQSKTGKEIQVPIHDDLKSWLRTHRNSITAVFPTLEGRQTGGTNGLSHGFAKLLREAGIQREEIRERSGEKGRVVYGLSCHALRHTCNSLLANSGV